MTCICDFPVFPPREWWRKMGNIIGAFHFFLFFFNSKEKSYSFRMKWIFFSFSLAKMTRETSPHKMTLVLKLRFVWTSHALDHFTHSLNWKLMIDSSIRRVQHCSSKCTKHAGCTNIKQIGIEGAWPIKADKKE